MSWLGNDSVNAVLEADILCQICIKPYAFVMKIA